VRRSFCPNVLEKALRLILAPRQPMRPLSIRCLMRPCGNVLDILEALAKMLEGV
jgi:hypothetical protein